MLKYGYLVSEVTCGPYTHVIIILITVLSRAKVVTGC